MTEKEKRTFQALCFDGEGWTPSLPRPATATEISQEEIVRPSSPVIGNVTTLVQSQPPPFGSPLPPLDVFASDMPSSSSVSSTVNHSHHSALEPSFCHDKGMLSYCLVFSVIEFCHCLVSYGFINIFASAIDLSLYDYWSPPMELDYPNDSKVSVAHCSNSDRPDCQPGKSLLFA